MADDHKAVAAAQAADDHSAAVAAAQATMICLLERKVSLLETGASRVGQLVQEQVQKQVQIYMKDAAARPHH